MSKPRLIAFYLPQYYPTKENDEWWQKGFTEWTNVGNAKPLFRGHYQPHVPADLGYYDLRVPEVREEQAQLAMEAGIEGFCYWHYWFAGRRLLDRVFREVVDSGKPDYPFCLCWANHSWYQKLWDPTKPDKLLIEQTYPGEQDYVDHFNALLPAFKDKRYIKVHGKLLFGIFAPLDFNDFRRFSKLWNQLAEENGLEGFHFFAYIAKSQKITDISNEGYDSIVYDGVADMANHEARLAHYYEAMVKRICRRPRIFSYDRYTSMMFEMLGKYDQLLPSINPNFDHTPRSAYRGFVFNNSNPQRWGEFCKKIFERGRNKEHEDNLVFIKAWNEWGEGNYLEPDLKFGKGYLNSLRKAYDNSL